MPACKLYWDINEISKTKYDVLIVGAGHNGLVAGSYLAKKDGYEKLFFC